MGPEPKPIPAAPLDERTLDVEEFLAIFKLRGLAGHLRRAREDGLIDCTAHEWERFCELVGVLGLDRGD